MSANKKLVASQANEIGTITINLSTLPQYNKEEFNSSNMSEAMYNYGSKRRYNYANAPYTAYVLQNNSILCKLKFNSNNIILKQQLQININKCINKENTKISMFGFHQVFKEDNSNKKISPKYIINILNNYPNKTPEESVLNNEKHYNQILRIYFTLFFSNLKKSEITKDKFNTLYKIFFPNKSEPNKEDIFKYINNNFDDSHKNFNLEVFIYRDDFDPSLSLDEKFEINNKSKNYIGHWSFNENSIINNKNFQSYATLSNMKINVNNKFLFENEIPDCDIKDWDTTRVFKNLSLNPNNIIYDNNNIFIYPKSFDIAGNNIKLALPKCVLRNDVSVKLYMCNSGKCYNCLSNKCQYANINNSISFDEINLLKGFLSIDNLNFKESPKLETAKLSVALEVKFKGQNNHHFYKFISKNIILKNKNIPLSKDNNSSLILDNCTKEFAINNNTASDSNPNTNVLLKDIFLNLENHATITTLSIDDIANKNLNDPPFSSCLLKNISFPLFKYITTQADGINNYIYNLSLNNLLINPNNTKLKYDNKSSSAIFNNIIGFVGRSFIYVEFYHTNEHGDLICNLKNPSSGECLDYVKSIHRIRMESNSFKSYVRDISKSISFNLDSKKIKPLINHNAKLEIKDLQLKSNKRIIRSDFSNGIASYRVDLTIQNGQKCSLGDAAISNNYFIDPIITLPSEGNCYDLNNNIIKYSKVYNIEIFLQGVKDTPCVSYDYINNKITLPDNSLCAPTIKKDWGKDKFKIWLNNNKEPLVSDYNSPIAVSPGDSIIYSCSNWNGFNVFYILNKILSAKPTSISRLNYSGIKFKYNNCSLRNGQYVVNLFTIQDITGLPGPDSKVGLPITIEDELKVEIGNFTHVFPLKKIIYLKRAE